uniref:Uncharacterized protein n=1 Tax=Cacopsylla melanoneura TaxID=428564 RepID=A0A8D8VBB3_9HEMI
MRYLRAHDPSIQVSVLYYDPSIQVRVLYYDHTPYDSSELYTTFVFFQSLHLLLILSYLVILLMIHQNNTPPLSSSKISPARFYEFITTFSSFVRSGLMNGFLLALFIHKNMLSLNKLFFSPE